MDEPLEPALSEDSQRIRVIRAIPRLELLALVLFLVLADLTIYRGAGYAGLMAFVLAAPVLLVLGTKKLPRTLMATWLGVLLLLVSAKLLWSGTALAGGYGIVLVIAFAMELAGITPFVLHLAGFSLHLLVAGFLRLDDYYKAVQSSRWTIPRAKLLQYGLPLAAVWGFGGIFVMANPDLATQTGDWLRSLSESLGEMFSRFAPSWSEGLFWLAMAWIFAGLVKPLTHSFVPTSFSYPPKTRTSETEPQESAMYPAYFNTLIAVIVLFVAYLVFEFQTLWLTEFPEGFHYSGYAHEGAAWLTIALALATLVLSMIFRADVLNDPRLPKLRRLAWIWSALNLCLAAAVYHRLMIYVGFNGMTRMRCVGFLGITAVVAGFLLVVQKITTGRDFVWLIRRQLWVVAFAGFLFAVLPVDSLVHRYNVHRILAGDPAPSVQISVHPMDSGGQLELIPLLDADNTIIREGVRAMLAQKAFDLQKNLGQSGPPRLDQLSMGGSKTFGTLGEFARTLVALQIRRTPARRLGNFRQIRIPVVLTIWVLKSTGFDVFYTDVTVFPFPPIEFGRKSSHRPLSGDQRHVDILHGQIPPGLPRRHSAGFSPGWDVGLGRIDFALAVFTTGQSRRAIGITFATKPWCCCFCPAGRATSKPLTPTCRPRLLIRA